MSDSNKYSSNNINNQAVLNTNIFFCNNVDRGNNMKNFCVIEENNQYLYKLKIENICGDFFYDEKIYLDPHGLNILNSINKDGNYYFGPALTEVHNKIIFQINYNYLID
jgi:hypothetical protein